MDNTISCLQRAYHVAKLSDIELYTTTWSERKDSKPWKIRSASSMKYEGPLPRYLGSLLEHSLDLRRATIDLIVMPAS